MDREILEERFKLATERIKEIVESGERLSQENAADENERCFLDLMSEVFQVLAKKLDNDIELRKSVSKEQYKTFTSQLIKANESNFSDILGSAYDKSFGNPEYVYNKLEFLSKNEDRMRLTNIISFLFSEITAVYAECFSSDIFRLTVICELFLECMGIAGEDEDISIKIKNLKDAVYYYESDYIDEWATINVCDRLLLKNRYYNIIMNADLSDETYMYMFGQYISQTEVNMCRFLSGLGQSIIDRMADNLVQGYFKGFVNAGIDIKEKKYVNIRYNIGFERVVRAVIERLAQHNLYPVIYSKALYALDRGTAVSGVMASPANTEYDYDHRFDKALFLDKELLDNMLVHHEKYYKMYSKQAAEYAGPMLIETFGKEEGDLKPKKCACALSEKQNEMFNDYKVRSNIMVNKYVDSAKTSFSIVAYPLTDIGKDFEKIFHEVLEINCLDTEVYGNIQKKLIDVLDKADSVYVEGMNGNQTKLTVKLAKLNDPVHETRFENCLADVNIPLGEVFTSPMLKGTTGRLNVSCVYLESYMYKDLVVDFKDGMVEKFDCSNFEDKDKCRDYIKENVLMGHDSLPMGEFAIGTNTRAYTMARKYGIENVLPILIAEKTGPHFAVGDTCYRMSEDADTFNPDGKRIAAKDNEVTLNRKTDKNKAYFGCHTDITLPYSELGLLTCVMEDGSRKDIIREGRFVLEGTEELNKALLT